MKYNLFDELKNKYGIPCPIVYSMLFSGIRFIPGTIEEKDNIISVDAKPINDYDVEFKVFFVTNKNMYNDSIITDIYFMYSFNNYIISNIHITEEGLTFDFECFEYDLYTLVSKEKNDRYPNPKDFREFLVSGDYKDTGIISKDGKDNVITYVLRKHNEVKLERTRK